MDVVKNYHNIRRQGGTQMTKDLTEGKITPILVKFTIPLVMGNVFQLTYNAVDSIVVGHFVGKDALAAVGTCNPVMTLMILFLNGLCMGASILMGMQYGAKDYKTLERQVSTTLLSGVVFSVFIAILCILFARPILIFLQVDSSILDIAVEYMRIVFCGLIFTYLYNFFSSTMRALGDSMASLYFLMISAIINILGDLFFVCILHWNSAGCALATVISEAISAVCCVIYIQWKVPTLQLGRKWLVFDKHLLKKTISYGWASAMQQATVQLGKIGVQAIVNTMGVSMAAAFAVVNRIDDFAIMPEQNIAHAMTALMAQNRGAGKLDRMKKGFWSGLMLECIYGLTMTVICFWFARPLMMLFTKEKGVILHGVTYLKLIAVIYVVPGITNGLQGYFRGIGEMKVTLLSSFINMGLRVLAVAVFVLVLDIEMEAIPMAYLIGWIGMTVVELPLLMKNMKRT